MNLTADIVTFLRM